MWKWIHHILEPHCPECKAELEDSRICQSCETLKHQLEVMSYTQRELVKTITEISKPEVPVSNEVRDYEPIKPRTVPWQVKRQLLEEEDRVKARIISENEKLNKKLQEEASINKLESELGVK